MTHTNLDNDDGNDDDDVYLNKLQRYNESVTNAILYMNNIDQPIWHK
jgi:hypothetical protein